MKTIINSLENLFVASNSIAKLISATASAAFTSITDDQKQEVVTRITNAIRSEQGKLKMANRDSQWIKTKLTKKGLTYGKSTKEDGKLEVGEDEELATPLVVWHWFIQAETFEAKTGMKVGSLNSACRYWIESIAEAVINPPTK